MEEKKTQEQVSQVEEVSILALPEEKAILGFRGILAIQTIIYIIFEIFFPAAVAHSANDKGPRWQLILRNSFSLFLWNPSLIRASLIILSARTICLPFLENSTRITLVSAIVRRPFRLAPLSVALAIATLLNGLSKTNSFIDFKTLTGNVSLSVPYKLPSVLTYFNSLYTLFWTVRDYPNQAASKAFYNDSLWAISVIFTQSYTVYLASAIIPYTRPKWRLGTWTLFILTAWWVQSWAWYSISGVLLADAATHMNLRRRMVEGITISKARRFFKVNIPGWVFGAFCLLTGGALQFFWVEWRPWFSDSPSGVAQPQARDDDYLVVMGILLLLESQQWLRSTMGNPFFVAVGKRSLSLYLVGSIALNKLGVVLFLHLVQARGLSSAGATAVSIAVCLVLTPLLTEVFYRLIEIPTNWASCRFKDWLLE